jgi:hypothetical protein
MTRACRDAGAAFQFGTGWFARLNIEIRSTKSETNPKLK